MLWNPPPTPSQPILIQMYYFVDYVYHIVGTCARKCRSWVGYKAPSFLWMTYFPFVHHIWSLQCSFTISLFRGCPSKTSRCLSRDSVELPFEPLSTMSNYKYKYNKFTLFMTHTGRSWIHLNRNLSNLTRNNLSVQKCFKIHFKILKLLCILGNFCKKWPK